MRCPPYFSKHSSLSGYISSPIQHTSINLQRNKFTTQICRVHKNLLGLIDFNTTPLEYLATYSDSATFLDEDSNIIVLHKILYRACYEFRLNFFMKTINLIIKWEKNNAEGDYLCFWESITWSARFSFSSKVEKLRIQCFVCSSTGIPDGNSSSINTISMPWGLHRHNEDY